MSNIKNTEMLQAETRRLKSVIRYKETRIREDITGFREWLSPAHIFSGTYEKITGEPPKKTGKGFTGQLIKTGLSLLVGKVLVKAEEKAEQRVYGLVDTAFDKLKDLVERKFNSRNKKNNHFEGPEEDDE
jgi:hypothetical protein